MAAAKLPGEDALCQSTLAPGTATGKVVLCNRGINGRIDKGRRVLAGGAVGMILTNNSAAVTDLESDNHYLPAIQTQFNSNAIANFVSGHTNVMATWAQGTASPAQPDVMASFSSRGPTRRLDQAGRHRSGCPGARGHDAAARPDDGRQRAAREPLPGDRGHLDVQPALRRRLGARQGGAPDVDACRDQVGADDLVGAERSSRKTASRRRTRSTWVPARSAPTARSTRRSSSTRPTRTWSPRAATRCTAST